MRAGSSESTASERPMSSDTAAAEADGLARSASASCGSTLARPSCLHSAAAAPGSTETRCTNVLPSRDSSSSAGRAQKPAPSRVTCCVGEPASCGRLEAAVSSGLAAAPSTVPPAMAVPVAAAPPAEPPGKVGGRMVILALAAGRARASSRSLETRRSIGVQEEAVSFSPAMSEGEGSSTVMTADDVPCAPLPAHTSRISTQPPASSIKSSAVLMRPESKMWPERRSTERERLPDPGGATCASTRERVSRILRMYSNFRVSSPSHVITAAHTSRGNPKGPPTAEVSSWSTNVRELVDKSASDSTNGKRASPNCSDASFGNSEGRVS
mmetsp:Transcript_26377/g.65194  ORF Transcript_26377/g.65194 Transcript_26377/m.65194 type:complete len:326 (-) Transcript_26377:1234-2211(-)